MFKAGIKIYQYFQYNLGHQTETKKSTFLVESKARLDTVPEEKQSQSKCQYFQFKAQFDTELKLKK